MDFHRDYLSVIVPLFNEESNLPELHRRLKAVVTSLGFARAEVLLVDDGSTDSSESLIRKMVNEDSMFKGIFLTRNFGHQAALSTGLSHARGSIVVMIDGDLQDPPETIPQLISAIEAGADVAYGVRKSRKESFLKRTAYATFYRLLKKVADIEIPLDTGDFACMTRRVVDAIIAMPERTRFLRGLRAWVGYRQTGVPYERAARFAGQSKYSLRGLFGLAYDGLFSFSKTPIRIMQFLGFGVSISALCVAIWYVIWWFIAGRNFPAGFATLAVSIWFLGGVQLLFLGFIGEYVVRGCEESRGRPIALVREIVEKPGGENPACD